MFSNDPYQKWLMEQAAKEYRNIQNGGEFNLFKEKLYTNPYNQKIEINFNMDVILGHLREALAECKDEQDVSRSRALSLVMTKIEEAILWRQEDLRLKKPVENQENK